MIDLPDLLNIPKKLLPVILRINDFRYFLLEGGRGSAKTQSVGRILSYLADQKNLRIICGRETQNSIEESVYTVFVDIILKFDLFFDVKKSVITHKMSGSTIRFRGFREQGAVNIKGLEGVDIIWIEEAQTMTRNTLNILLPTIRKQNSKIFFSMNRFLRNDAVFEEFSKRPDCLHININFDENPFFPEVLRHEEQECLRRNPKEHKHIWLGQPLDNATEYLFNFAKLAKAMTIEPFGDLFKHQCVMSVDFASGGGDLCVASKLDRVSNVHWELAEQVAWDDPDTDHSVGKVIDLYGQWQPDIIIVDAGGLGYPMFISLSKTIKNIIGFDGAKTERISENAGNERAEAYMITKEFIDREWFICKSDYTVKELETIKKKFTANGRVYIQSKKDAKAKDNTESQDRGDSVAMGFFAIKHFLGKVDFKDEPIGMRAKRISGRKKIE